MRSLSNEFASFGITFNTVAIGLIDTGTAEKIVNDGETKSLPQAEPQPLISAKRSGRPEELAAQVVFLASERASYVGQPAPVVASVPVTEFMIRSPGRMLSLMEVGRVVSDRGRLSVPELSTDVLQRPCIPCLGTC